MMNTQVALSATVQSDIPAAARIADYVWRMRFDDLSDLSVLRAGQVVLDFIGVALGGVQTPLGKRTIDYAAQFQPGRAATLVGDGRFSSLEGAAFAIAVNSCILGMGDSHRLCSHVASEVVPVALAVGEAHKASGREVIAAIAAGYDLFGAIQPVVKAAQRKRGLDHKGQVGSLASAVVAGKLMGLDAEGLTQALTLAADMACGTEQYTFDAGLGDTESLTAGFGARNGIMAAQLAAAGFRGAPGAIDGPYGYFHAFGDGFDATRIDQMGQVSMVATTGFKPHSGCRHVHSCVDATQALLAAGRPPLDQIASIEVGSYRNAITPSFRVNPAPHDAEAAAYSLVATVATVLKRGSWYREDILAFDDPESRRLWPLVKVVLDEEIEAGYPATNGCMVTVTTADGRLYRGRVDYAKGEPENMLSDDELAQKFRRVAGGLLPASQRDALLDAAKSLATLDDVGELARLATPPHP